MGLRDRRLAAVVRRCRDLPGQELFQYVDEDGEPIDVASDDVNDYLRAIAPDVTAKDFRTWAGTVLAYRALRALDEPATATEAKRNVVSAIRDTADQLGNTAAVCRQAYVHPVVVEAYLDRRMRGALVGAAEATGAPPGAITPAEERAVVRLLERRLARDAARSRPSRSRRRRSVGLGVGRQREPQLGPAVGPRPRPDPAAHRLDEAARDEERDPEPQPAGRRRLVDEREAHRQLGRRRVGPAVEDADGDLALARLDPDDDRRLEPAEAGSPTRCRLRTACST